MQLPRSLRLAAVFLLIASVFALALACGDDDDGDSTGSTGAATGSTGSTGSTGGSSGDELSGSIDVDGSSTVFPITEAVAEEFRSVAPEVQVTVGVSGSGGGFERFCNGETDISNASRTIGEDEIATCESNGIEFVELEVAYDGLSVVVSNENDFVDCLTVEELNTIWAPEAEGSVTSWSDIRAEFPDEDLILYGPGTDSGTFDYFTDAINGEEGASRTDYTPSEDDNVLVQGVAGSANALGYFGLAYLEENTDSIKGVAVDGGNGCVEPSAQGVEDGSYAPLSRPLFVYVKVESAETKPQVAGFMDFYLENAATLSEDVGYVRLPAAIAPLVQSRWESRTTGTVFPLPEGTTLLEALGGSASSSGGSSMEDLSGSIDVDGSSTVFPITEAVAEEFRSVAPEVQVTVGVSGSGGGFERFCNGETDISNASRTIAEDEIATCESNGIEFVELEVAYDGLSVVVSNENDFVDCLTVEELNTIWAPEAEGSVTSWSDIRAEFPDEDLILYGPGTDSGTFDYFTDAINGEEGASRTDYTPSEDDNVLVQGVAGSANALGYFGLAYLEENTDSIRGVAVDSGNGCIQPSAATVEDGSYAPLSRPLFVYVKVESAETKPQVAGFMDFYLENAATLSEDVGYVRLPAAIAPLVQSRWESRTTGTVFPLPEGTTLQDALSN